MSRIGKLPISIPDGVKVVVNGSEVTVEGPKGKLVRVMHAEMTIRVDEGHVIVERPSDSASHRSLHGLTRSLVANMVEGVSAGFEKVMEMRGTGYRAELQGQKLVMGVGYSHPVEISIPDGIEVAATRQPIVDQMAVTQISIKGVDKQLVGEVAAGIRRVRPPEPYKGKGIRMLGEHVHRKAGKAAA